jgi:hypothetical protein
MNPDSTPTLVIPAGLMDTQAARQLRAAEAADAAAVHHWYHLPTVPAAPRPTVPAAPRRRRKRWHRRWLVRIPLAALALLIGLTALGAALPAPAHAPASVSAPAKAVTVKPAG